MKRSLVPFLAFFIISCGSTKSEDTGVGEVTPGVYAGRIVCDFCPKTATVLHLRPDGTFVWKDSVADGNRWESGNGVLLRTTKNRTVSLVAESDKLRTVAIKKTTGRRDYYLQKFPDVFGKTWKLAKLGDAAIQAEEVRVPTLLLSADEFRAAGNSGCNAYSGQFELSQGHRIVFGPVAATKMFCHDALYEADFLRMLDQTDRLQLQNDTLVLFGQRRPLARFVTE